jgi:subtilisin family serine protease
MVGSAEFVAARSGREHRAFESGQLNPVDVVRLEDLMKLGEGSPDVTIALIDGPVAVDHPDLAVVNVRRIGGKLKGSCTDANSLACAHGTCVAGILFARRGSVAPAICPGCTLLLRPIFAETASRHDLIPSTSPEQLAEAVVECVDSGARIINLSSALIRPSRKGEDKLEEALNHATQRGAITVAAAGNQGNVGSSVITRHPWVIPVAACDLQGKPLRISNLGRSIGRGLSAPGEGITSLGTDGRPRTFDGTSAAAPFVTGAIALLWSRFTDVTPARMRLAVTQTGLARREAIVPPTLDAWAAYQALATAHTERRSS